MITIALLFVATLCHAQSNGGRGDNLPNVCMAGDLFVRTGANPGACVCASANNWSCPSTATGIPQGAMIFIDSGTCPQGYAESTEMNGKTLIGTLAANGNVGQTGGSDSLTPQGTISAINQVINHTHTVSITDPGHVHPEGYRNTGTAGTAGVQGASTANNASIAGGVLSAVTGISATTANPAGGVASVTPTFSGQAADNRSAFVRVIVCKKT